MSKGTFWFAGYLEGTNADNQQHTMKNTLKKNWDRTDDCPVRNVLDRFADKWSTLILLILGDHDRMRFTELNKAIGDVSQKMLTVTLRTLEADGLISRTVYAEVPPRVEYQITPMGKTLVPHIHRLAEWANEHYAAIGKSRKKFTVRNQKVVQGPLV